MSIKELGSEPMLINFSTPSKWRTLYEKAKENYWQPETLDVQPDKIQWLDMPKSLKRTVMGLLQYAILLDSYQVDNISAFCHSLSDPQLKALLASHANMEAVHSQSYSYWAEAVCTQKQKTWLYQDTKQTYSRLGVYKTLEVKAGTTLANYFLEGVSFQALFRLSDILKVEGFLPGFSAILNLIKRDEDLHVATFQGLIKTPLTTVQIEAFKAAIIEEAAQIFDITENKLLSEYIEYIGAIRLKALGVPTDIPENPLKHLEAYNDTTKQNLKANFFTSNVVYSQRDESLDWQVDNWFDNP
jgi:ribonucleotide reductase beta subunit family protein with ferritin-like domain